MVVRALFHVATCGKTTLKNKNISTAFSTTTTPRQVFFCKQLFRNPQLGKTVTVFSKYKFNEGRIISFKTQDGLKRLLSG
jgi:hypothetical protein